MSGATERLAGPSTISVEALSPALEPEVSAFVARCRSGLIYYSLQYRDFLRRVLPNGRDVYLVARQNGRVVGLLPAFVAESAAQGRILNSLPFYGSHGGALVDPDADATGVRTALLDEFHDMARTLGVRSCTLIANPLDSDGNAYAQDARTTHIDRRIGQMTTLPAAGDAIEETLFRSFHQKTRNAVRKGLREQFQITRSTDWDDLAWLHAVHAQNMAAIGGMAKPFEVFGAIKSSFAAERDYVIYLAMRDGERAAGLLVLFWNGVAEYFTPVIVDAFRSRQPLSALIFHAMQEAVARGCWLWNWGGTWLSQSGVYRFKQRWGAIDHPYDYYVRVLDTQLLTLPRPQLAAAFPFFYLFPFGNAQT